MVYVGIANAMSGKMSLHAMEETVLHGYTFTRV